MWPNNQTSSNYNSTRTFLSNKNKPNLIISKNTAVDVNTIEDWNKLKKNYQKLKNIKYA